MVGGTPLQTKDFSWHILTNWSHDKYTYHKLDPDYSTKRPWIKEGADWDWIAIYDWERDLMGISFITVEYLCGRHSKRK